ncbi:MAG TPA: hypothetical protein VFC19_08810 [Candidatus Limnocylindrales bacterium]|nr:hypothetical protein [Candidatus Limnocylindrales bacterium]
MTSLIARIARVTPVPLILRVIVFISAFLALWLAAPEQASTPRFFLLMASLAALPGLFPGTRVVDFVMVSVLAGWVLTTLVAEEPAEPWRVFEIATALYVSHSASALAAVVPYDAVVDAQVPLRWAARCGLVIIGAGLVTAAIVQIARTVTPGSSVPVLLVGLAVVIGTVALLSRRL